MTRRPNSTPPSGPGLTVTLQPHERSFLRANRTHGGVQDLENWVLENLDGEGVVKLDPVHLERLIRCCKNYGSGGPQSRLRAAFIPALRRVGVDVLPQWRAP